MTENNMTLPEHTTEYLNNPKGKLVLLTLLYIIKLISNRSKHLIKPYPKQYPQLNPSDNQNTPIPSPDNYRCHISTNQITNLERYTEHYTDMTCDIFFSMSPSSFVFYFKIIDVI